MPDVVMLLLWGAGYLGVGALAVYVAVYNGLWHESYYDDSTRKWDSDYWPGAALAIAVWPIAIFPLLGVTVCRLAVAHRNRVSLRRRKRQEEYALQVRERESAVRLLEAEIESVKQLLGSSS